MPGARFAPRVPPSLAYRSPHDGERQDRENGCLGSECKALRVVAGALGNLYNAVPTELCGLRQTSGEAAISQFPLAAALLDEVLVAAPRTV
jgi:hypothetical protein